MINLFEIVMPENDEVAELYIHKHKNIYKFDTYFNSFPVLKFLKYTNLYNLIISLELFGKAKIEIFTEMLNKDGKFIKTCIASKQIDSTAKNSFDFSVDLKAIDLKNMQNVILYPVVTLKQNSIFYSGKYCTEQGNAHSVNCQIVFCTYRREEYIKKNAKKISDFIVKNHLEDILNVLVIDNGNTLNDINLKNIKIIQNKNTGGSGGFARGMREAVRDKRNFTHVILMDDDVEFDESIFKKVIAFLRYRRKEHENVCIGGGMLVLERPFEQFESGGNVDGWKLKGRNMLMDLRKTENIIRNDTDEKIDFNGWWLMFIPVEVIRNNGLPLPLFLKYDDIEYAFRCKSDIVTINGVSVWHEMFEKKYNFSTEYYIARNRLIFMAIHAKRLKYIDFLCHLFDEVYEKLICYQYDTAELILKAYGDFLKGADFLLKTEPEKLHLEVKKYDSKMMNYSELDKINCGFNEKEYRKSLDEMKTKRRLESEIVYKVVDLFRYNPVNFRCIEKVLLYNIHNRTGVMLELDKKRFFKLLRELLRYIPKSVAFWKAKKSFVNKQEELQNFFENK